MSKEQLHIRIKNKDLEAHFSLGRIYFEEKDYDKAREHFECYKKFMETQKQTLNQVLLWLSRTYFKLKDSKPANKFLGQYIDLLEDKAETHLETRELFIQLCLTELDNKLLLIHKKIGEYYFKIGNFEPAAKHFRKHENNLDKKSEWDPGMCFLQGQIYSKQNNWKKAQGYLEKYIFDLAKEEDAKPNVEANKLLIMVYKKIYPLPKDFSNFKKKCSKLLIISEDSQSAQTYFENLEPTKMLEFAKIFKKNKNSQFSMLAFEKAMEVDPKNAAIPLINYYLATEKSSYGKECLKKAKNFPEIAYIFLADLFRITEGSKDYKKSIFYYEKCLKLEELTASEKVWINFYLGSINRTGGFGIPVNIKLSVDYFILAASNADEDAYDALWDIYEKEVEFNMELKIHLSFKLALIGHDFINNDINLKDLIKSKKKEKLVKVEIMKLLTFASDNGHVLAKYFLLTYYSSENKEESEWQTWFQAAIDKENLDGYIGLAKIELQHAKSQANLEEKTACSKRAIDLLKNASLNYPPAKRELRHLTNQLITSILYEALRHHVKHAWNINASQCKPYFNLLVYIDNKYQNYTAKGFNEEIMAEETSHHTFFGDDLSDNSDSDDEKVLQRSHPMVKQAALIQSMGLFAKSDMPQVKSILGNIKEGTEYKTNTKILKPETKIGKSYVNPTDKVLTDLRELNYWRNQGKLADGLKRSSTTFMIAHYRGITHMVTSWSQSARRRHRKMSEIGLPLFSASVLREEKLDYGFDYEHGLPDAVKKSLKTNAEKLKLKLLALRNTAPHLAEFKSKGETKTYEFPNVACFLQDTYTKHYDGFHELLDKLDKLKEGETWQGLPKLDLLNSSNPFISTGDVPLHALKYAYGIKPYKSHKHERLRPRWRKEGAPHEPYFRAERPYSGKVYLTLHTIEEYDNDHPLHVLSLNHLAKIRIDSQRGYMILPERETTFPAYIPAGRVVYTHIAKYPSYKGPYKDIYAIKYGMDKELYELFQQALHSYPPHSGEMEMVKILMGEYLCHYHQHKLIEQANFEAAKRNAILVYVDEFGHLSLDLPRTPQTKGQDHLNITDLRKRYIKDAEEEEIAMAIADSEEEVEDDEKNNERAPKRPRT